MNKRKLNTEFTVYYDTETNGLPKNNGLEFPAIMQIVIFDSNGNTLFSSYVKPFDNIIDCSDIHGITAGVLRKNNALTMRKTAEEIIKVLSDNYEGYTKINWIAYNNFGFDQGVLETNFREVGVKIPSNWYFIDLYPIIKELYPNMKPNYKLKTVYQVLTKISDEKLNKMNFHNAETDVYILYTIDNIIKSNTNYNEMIEKYYRPSMSQISILDCCLSVLYGYNNNFPDDTIIKDLMDIYKDCSFDMKLFQEEIYSLYDVKYCKNIVNSLNTINSFLNLK